MSKLQLGSMRNIRDIIEGRLPLSLAFVFDQLEKIGVKRAGDYRRPKPRPLTTHERAAIQAQLRRDLEASVAALNANQDTK